ncbi:hypothetical protein HYPBUDRAFT_210387 [Hyphopichia burtonii NRRL Y-1933]|uniref:Uncharacterized protein n=1 Tax=Hyphopichia burtonii NRRL Y-1933 TaxID=984485 RepID=A0A1E4RJC7_9ASCO|nr:hypothetical protein HYPBUDRAFT_210387 [Hyphopichia burtonii NRRL Y-1933]ODV67353.1 hypothetical protein HYPBUDRAFT_210387 [Hyphopichia burtonii NRRL Y-1933]
MPLLIVWPPNCKPRGAWQKNTNWVQWIGMKSKEGLLSTFDTKVFEALFSCSVCSLQKTSRKITLVKKNLNRGNYHGSICLPLFD